MHRNSMVWLVLILAGFMLAVLLLNHRAQHTFSPKTDELDSDDWKYGDVWKQDFSDESDLEENVKFVPILRGETGRGYNDTLLNDFILYLGSKGIRASYDSYPLEQINIYVLKVEIGKENEAITFLKRKFSEKIK